MNSLLKTLMKEGKCLLLAYDQGLEHGPEDFNDKNVDPEYILQIAAAGKYSGVILQKGIAEKYYAPYHKKVPLILKLNGKTKLVNGDPVATQLCSVKEAVKLGAVAVGYTLYIGSEHESEMFAQFSRIEEEAHEKHIPVIVWAYPRGKAIANELDKKILAYSARVGLELGADLIKMKYNGNPAALKWMVKAAGKAGIVIAGGSKIPREQLLKESAEAVKAGAVGLAVGRNVWQRDDPIAITEKLKSCIW